MKTFSRLSLFFALLSITLMLVGGTADAQEPYLKVIGSSGFDGNAQVGASLRVVFEAGYDGVGRKDIPLRITATPGVITVTSPTPVPGTHNTGTTGGLPGILVVNATLNEANADYRIEARWNVPGEGNLIAFAEPSSWYR